MNYIYAIESNDTALSHHGTKGQKWGVRRYQNADGSLTDAGRKHYGKAVARKDYKINRLKRKQEKTNRFSRYRKLDKKIRETETRKARKKQGLTQKDIENAKKYVARFRTAAATLGTIGKASATVAGSAFILSNPVTALATPIAAVAGAAITYGSAKKIPYYFEETRRFSKGNPKSL